MRQEVALARANAIGAIRSTGSHQPVHRAALRVRWEVLGLYLVALGLAASAALVAVSLDALALGVGLFSMGCCAGVFIGEAVYGRRSR